MMRTKSRSRGFTLVELMIVIAIIGVLAALAIGGVRDYLSAARASEAKAGVGAISKLAAGVFERESAASELLNGPGNSLVSTQSLCDSAAPVPNAVPVGVKYQPNLAPDTDFQKGTTTAAWVCVGFKVVTPIYYQYNYYRSSGYLSPTLGGPDPGPDGFEAAAVGNLDGDSTNATFARTGIIVGRELHVSTQIFVDNEFE